jgi:hypothetical protein
MDPLLLAGLISGGLGALSGIGSWLSQGGSFFKSPREKFIEDITSDPEKLKRFGYIPPEDFRRALSALYSAQLTSAQSLATQRGFASGVGGSTIEALATKARTPLDVARMSHEVSLMEASSKSLMDAINLALQRAQFLSGESPFETMMGVGGTAFDIALGIYKLGLTKDYLDVLKNWVKPTGGEINPSSGGINPLPLPDILNFLPFLMNIGILPPV